MAKKLSNAWARESAQAAERLPREDSDPVPRPQNYDVVVIGGGPAGLSAASACGRKMLRTALFEGDCLGGILTRMCPDKRIDNYPGLGRGVLAQELASSLIDEARQAGVDLFGERVDEITREGETRAGEHRVRGKAVILAGGSTAAEASIPREREFAARGKGVAYAIRDPFLFRGKRVVVIGGGDTAHSHVERLLGVAERITLVHRQDALRTIHWRPEECDPGRGVEILLGTAVETFLGNDRLEAVRLRKTATGEAVELSADAAVIAVGRKPNSAMFEDLRLSMDPRGRILTDPWQRTNVPRIFAVGDVASHLKMIVTAVSQGATAAHRAYEDIREVYWK
jgi:thioredoxin reductase (NADPH)